MPFKLPNETGTRTSHQTTIHRPVFEPTIASRACKNRYLIVTDERSASPGEFMTAYIYGGKRSVITKT